MKPIFPLIAILACCVWSDAEPPTFSANDVAMFEKDVLPILKNSCFKCHGNEAKIKGGLRLTDRESVLKGGDTGAAVNLSKPAESLLLKAINYQGELQMPPTGKLSVHDIDTLTRWVNSGLPWSPSKTESTETKAHTKPKSDGKDYWAYQPIKRSEVPSVKNSTWVRTPIDAFILAKLEAKGLTPNPPADPVAFIRRITYDLTGLPPAPEEIDAFVQSTIRNPQSAIENLIDRLLASPHYGEKWGRHWLDLVRFAESNGYERDGPKPFAWRYRDYVIRSFNADKPFDRFIKEQLAGDELPDGGTEGIIATGYYRLGLWDDEPADPQQSLFDGYDDIVSTTGQVFLGMTVNCCRCHDHKIDPLPQRDYYRMVAFFRDIRPFSDTRDTKSRFNLTDITPPEQKKLYEAELAKRQARLDELKEQIKPIENQAILKMPPEDQLKVQDGKRDEIIRKVPDFLDPEEKRIYLSAKHELDDIRRKPTPHQEFALSVNNCNPRPPKTHVLVRGNPHSPAAEVTPGFPSVLGFDDPNIPAPSEKAKTSGRRTALAEWIASPKNPMTARVLVNRLWHFHFGRGIVASTNDFGQFGEKPTHPELLDWLADEFMRGGWTIKRMHKMMLMSRAYQMSSMGNEAGLKGDPANHLLWRFPMRRLLAEEVRDSVLAVSGLLNLQMYGPSVFPPLPKEVLQGQSMPGDGWQPSPADQSVRRSVYVCVKRSLQVPLLATHDQADTDSSCPVRYTTTVPTQALGMLNGQFMQDQARAMAERLIREFPDEMALRVRKAIRLTTGRQPNETEIVKDIEFINGLMVKHDLSMAEALRQYCLMILNANEFVYLD